MPNFEINRYQNGAGHQERCRKVSNQLGQLYRKRDPSLRLLFHKLRGRDNQFSLYHWMGTSLDCSADANAKPEVVCYVLQVVYIPQAKRFELVTVKGWPQRWNPVWAICKLPPPEMAHIIDWLSCPTALAKSLSARLTQGQALPLDFTLNNTNRVADRDWEQIIKLSHCRQGRP